MSLSRNVIDWERLKPRILQDLADGKTQQQIRQGLVCDSDNTLRVSISKSQLETQLKHWKYRQCLHEPEWKVISHRINKRRKAGKPFSQLLVNGFIFNERKVAKAINRYDTPSLAHRLPSPQIPPELSHHLIEVRTPPSIHLSLQPRPSEGTVAQTRRENLSLHLNSAERICLRTTQWRNVELSVGQFVARTILPRYILDKTFREAFDTGRRRMRLPEIHQAEDVSASSSGHGILLRDQAWHNSSGFQDSLAFDRDEMQRLLCASTVHIAVVKTFVGLLCLLSNRSLDVMGRRTLVWILEVPGWDRVLPHLRNSLITIDSKIIQAIADGLLNESIWTCHPGMLNLSLELGADTMQQMRNFKTKSGRVVFSTPLVVFCRHCVTSGPKLRNVSTEKVIFSLLKNQPRIPDSTLLWIIRAGCHTMVEDMFRSQPERGSAFAIAVCDLEEGFWHRSNSPDPVTPLLVACSDTRQSAGKLSLIRYLLECNAKPDLKAMIVAARTGDTEVISLLQQHGAPVNGFISKFGSPLSSACEAAFDPVQRHYATFPAISLLLSLGASPYTMGMRGLDSWEPSPLHILALAQESPAVIKALDLLLEHGADMNHRERFHKYRPLALIPSHYGELAETVLEYAIVTSRWITATKILSANCELTGKEILFVNSRINHHSWPSEQIASRELRSFIAALLAKAPNQAAVLHWSGLTVLQRAIQTEGEDMVLALFEFGVTPMPADLLYMLCDRFGTEKAKVCELSSSIQMKLILAAEFSWPLISDISTIRLILAFACPEVVRFILDRFPDVYDSEGLCYVVARVLSKDRTPYFSIYSLNVRVDCLTIDDLRTFLSRRTISNRHEDWESTAIMLTARAGRADILQMIIESGPHCLRSNCSIPLLLLQEVLKYDWRHEDDGQSDALIYQWNTGRLWVWISHCRMDKPNTRCSPLTAAVMAVLETAAEELVDLLLELGYQPDGWTVLMASCQGRLSILERLKSFENWTHILNHRDRPDWCPTALQAAVRRAQVSVVRFLLDAGTMINAVDLPPCQPLYFDQPGLSNYDPILPRTALQHAVEMRNIEMVTLLVNAGADVNEPAAVDSGATALQIASIQGCIQIVEHLMINGADLHAAGAARLGRSALQGAAEHGRIDVVELLLANSPSAAYQHRGELIEALYFAEKNAQHVVAKILRERLLSQWSVEDEDMLQIFNEDSESSSEGSAFDEFGDELDDWEDTPKDWPESLLAFKGNPDFVVNEQPLFGDSIAFQGDDA